MNCYAAARFGRESRLFSPRAETLCRTFRRRSRKKEQGFGLVRGT